MRLRRIVGCFLLLSAGVMLVGCGQSSEQKIRQAREKKRIEQEKRRGRADELLSEARAALDWVAVPGGSFRMGDNSFGGLPERVVEVAGFRIGRYEVTNEEYERFVEATDAVPPNDWVKGRCPEDRRRHPVSVPYVDAVVFAEWVGCRLPTKVEWEFAARGESSWVYPWGNDFDPALCNSKESERGDTMPVVSFPEGVSPYGCYNMAGNVKEWTSDRTSDGTRRVLKGGSYMDDERWVRPAFESTARETVEKNPTIGFRLAKDLE